MAEPASAAAALRLPPSEALAFFRQKLNVPTRHWDDLWHEAHARGFMVAGAASDALLADLRAAVDQAIAGKLTAQTFRQEFDAIVARHGWAHNGGAAWRSNLIYGVNTSMAHAAGRYARQTTPEALEMFPYWQYQHHTCQHPRPEHVAWSGRIFRADDPWWNTHYPPNGWKCHCTVNVLSERMMRHLGLEVSTPPPLNPRPWYNKRTGKTVLVPEGIDPGFAYNPGKAWQEGQSPQTGGRFKAEDADAPSGVSRPVVRSATLDTMPDAISTPHPAHTPLAPVPDEHRDDARRTAFTHLRAEVQAAVREGNESALKELGTRTIDVGVLPQEMADAMGAKTRKVLLSGATIKKQDQPDKHPELTEQDYALIPDILGNPDVVAVQDAKRLLFFRNAGRLYRLALKTTGDGTENYVLSLHYTHPQDAWRAIRHLKIIVGSVNDLAEGGNGAPGGPPSNPP